MNGIGELDSSDVRMLREICMTNKKMAVRLGITAHGVNARYMRLCRHFKVGNRQSLLVEALKLGIVKLEELYVERDLY